MRPKTPPFKPNETREEREHKLKAFIQDALDERTRDRGDAIAVLAHSPESPVVRAVLSLSQDLAARGTGAAIILAGGATAAENETWNLVFAGGFIHEIRLTSNPRILDGHEQLVIADRSIWYGDSMRRDPWKRDAFAMFLADAPIAARSGRLTFSRLWQDAQPIYCNSSLNSVVVAKAAPEPDHAPTSAPDVSDPAMSGALDANALLSETLEVWRPSRRH